MSYLLALQIERGSILAIGDPPLSCPITEVWLCHYRETKAPATARQGLEAAQRKARSDGFATLSLNNVAMNHDLLEDDSNQMNQRALILLCRQDWT